MSCAEKMQAEEATGVRANPRGVGKFYAFGGVELSAAGAAECIRNDGSVEVPNAGAGSYREVFEALGYKDVKTFDTGSSAGDWSFVVLDDGLWFMAFQSNRYPRYGFTYSVDIHGFETCEQAMKWASS